MLQFPNSKLARLKSITFEIQKIGLQSLLQSSRIKAFLEGKDSAKMGVQSFRDNGTFTSTSGSSTCSECPDGTCSLSGAADCTSCSDVHYSLFGSSSCKTCSAGSYSLSVAANCTSCCGGYYYSSTPGSRICTLCSIGNHSSLPGSTNCSVFPIAYSSVTGTSGCTLAIGYVSTRKSQR